MLTLPYSYNWQKLSNKMNEKKKPGVSEYGHPEYITRQIYRYSGASFETILLFDFCTTLKILKCFSLMKPFPNDHKMTLMQSDTYDTYDTYDKMTLTQS